MGGSLASEATALVILPILTRFLTPSEYGQAALFMTTLAFLTPLVGVSMTTHINRNFFKLGKAEMANVSFNALLGVLLSFLALLVLLLVAGTAFGSRIETAVGIPPAWIFVALAVGLVASVSSQYISFLRIKGRAAGYALFLFCSAGFNMALSLFFVAVCKWGWEGRAAGFALSALGASVFALSGLRRMGFAQGSLDRTLLRGLYRISLPLVPHQLSQRVTAMSSRLFLNGLVSKEAVGLYSMGYTFGALLHMPMQAFINAWLPWVFRRLAARNHKSDLEIVRLSYCVLVGLITLWALVAMVLPIVFRLVTATSYHGATKFIGWVALAFVFQGMYELLVPILVDEAKTDAIAVFTGTVAAISLVLNWSLIQHFGAMGAVYTAVACSIVRFGLVFWYTNRVRPMPWCRALLPGRAAS